MKKLFLVIPIFMLFSSVSFCEDSTAVCEKWVKIDTVKTIDSVFSVSYNRLLGAGFDVTNIKQKDSPFIVIYAWTYQILTSSGSEHPEFISISVSVYVYKNTGSPADMTEENALYCSKI